jgi:signal transduction histidine kinase
MNTFGGRTLRQKLALVLWGTALCAFASSGIGLAVFQGVTLERRARAIMEPYADLVSVGTDTAVAFEDPVRAQEILDTLRASPEILAADIVLDDGRILAHVGPRLDASGRISTPGVYLGDERVELVRNLQRGAMLHLTMSPVQLRRQTLHTLWLFGAAVVVLLAITVGQISVLQRTLVKPIAMLTQAAELVRKRGEYGQRVSASGTDEVARLGRSFNAMMQAIEERENDLRRLLAEQRVLEQALRESDRRKSEFLAVLSHELRNPLAPIRTSIELLPRSPPGSPIAARAWEIMKRQTEHLTRLVDDLLDVTRISRGRIELRRARVDLRDVVWSTCDDFRPLFERGTLQLRLEPMPAPVWIDADATRLAQVLGNLLHNAAKFTPAGGIVTVRVEASGGRAEVSVRDTGVGMEPGELKRLFEPFAQAEQGLARTQGGLGLGLALAKGLVELHGGSIQARSEGLGRGSEFIVSLPLGPGTPRANAMRSFAP